MNEEENLEIFYKPVCDIDKRINYANSRLAEKASKLKKGRCLDIN